MVMKWQVHQKLEFEYLFECGWTDDNGISDRIERVKDNHNPNYHSSKIFLQKMTHQIDNTTWNPADSIWNGQCKYLAEKSNTWVCLGYCLFHGHWDVVIFCINKMCAKVIKTALVTCTKTFIHVMAAMRGTESDGSRKGEHKLEGVCGDMNCMEYCHPHSKQYT